MFLRSIVVGAATLLLALSAGGVLATVEGVAGAVTRADVVGFGAAEPLGSPGETALAAEVVSMSSTSQGRGYWLVGADGGVFTYGDATFHGSAATLPLTAPIVGIAPTPTGNGYWLAGADGGVFTYGDATFHGSEGGKPDGQGVSAFTAHPAGGGYWLLLTSALPPPPPMPSGTLRPGGHGPAVLELQRTLTDLGYWLGAASGVYDTTTTHAVVAFQKLHGLDRDGIAGPRTLGAMATAQRPAGRSTAGRAVEIDLAHQVLMVVRDGRVVSVYDTSTGAVPGSTPAGHWTVYRQIDGIRVSPLGRLYRPKYFHGGVAMHGYPSVPPWPASHGCVRVINAAMDHIWASGAAPLGTAVWVYGGVAGAAGSAETAPAGCDP